jgi:hypothetical protein
VDPVTVGKVSEALIRLSDRHVYSRKRSSEVKRMVNRCAGTVRYGVNAFLPAPVRGPETGSVISADV